MEWFQLGSKDMKKALNTEQNRGHNKVGLSLFDSHTAPTLSAMEKHCTKCGLKGHYSWHCKLIHKNWAKEKGRICHKQQRREKRERDKLERERGEAIPEWVSTFEKNKSQREREAKLEKRKKKEEKKAKKEKKKAKKEKEKKKKKGKTTKKLEQESVKSEKRAQVNSPDKKVEKPLTWEERRKIKNQKRKKAEPKKATFSFGFS